MFWGLIMEPGKRYAQKVEKSFHISKACLDLEASGNEPVSVYVDTENKKFLICVLQKAVTVQSSLDLNFMLGDKIAFFIVGKGSVHLTGYLHDTEEDMDAVLSEEESEEEEIVEKVKQQKSNKRKEQPQTAKQTAKKLKVEDEEEDSDEDDSDVDLSDLEGIEEEEDDDEEMEEEDGEEDDEDDSDEEQQPVQPPPKKSKKQKQKEKKEQQMAQSPVQQDKKAGGGAAPKPQTPQVNGTPNAQQSGKKNKKNKGGETPGAAATPKNQQQSPAQAGGQTPQKRTLEGGVSVEDLKVGNGAPAKPGKLVTVYYTGRLKQNNKQFDATNQGPGFKFRLGKGEVIKGWDIGLNGMKIGGKRRIVIPPHMAYGAKGSPPVIPPNSALVFEVELRNVN